jgi:hypothetical protein
MSTAMELNSLEAASNRTVVSVRSCTKAEDLFLRLDFGFPMLKQSWQIGTPYSDRAASLALQNAQRTY